MSHYKQNKHTLTRRQVVRVLTASAVTGSMAAGVLQQPLAGITSESLRQAAKVFGHDFNEERLQELTPVMDKDLGKLQAVRDLEIAESVEPAIIFRARRSATPENKAEYVLYWNKSLDESTAYRG